MRLAVLAIAMLGVAVAANAQSSPEQYNLEASIVFWKPAPEILLTTGSLGTPVDFIETFGVEDKRHRDFRMVSKAGRHKFRYSTMGIDYDGTATLTQNIRFAGQTYPIGIPTAAELDWTLQSYGYEFDVISSPMGFLGGIVDLKYNKLKAQLSAPLVTLEAFERNIPVPTFGGIGRIYLSPNFSVTSEFTRFTLDREEHFAKFQDFDLYGTANFGRNFGFMYGYRHVIADYDWEGDAGNLKLKGRYFGFIVRF